MFPLPAETCETYKLSMLPATFDCEYTGTSIPIKDALCLPEPGLLESARGLFGRA